MSNPLIRTFVKKVTDKSFDQGFVWGIGTGVFVTHLYMQDKYKKLESKYSTIKHKFLRSQPT